MAINPYLQQQGAALQAQSNQNLRQNVLPGINSGAMQAGGFGGSRQGIAQGVAIGNAQTGLNSALAGMYGQAYEGDQNRGVQQSIASMQNDTQRQGLVNQYALGMGNLGLGYGNLGATREQNQNQYSLGLGNLGLGFQNSAQNYSLGQQQNQTAQYNADTSRGLGQGNLDLGYRQADQNFYTQQRGQDINAMDVGGRLYGQGMTGLGAQGTGLQSLGVNEMNASAQPMNTYADLLSRFSGLNQTNQTNQGGSALAGGLGGALTAAQLYKLFSSNP